MVGKTVGKKDAGPIGRLLIVQYGNYAEAWHRVQNGEPETYRDQFSSVSFVDSLADDREVITVALSADAHDEVLRPGLRSIGLPGHPTRRTLDGLIDSIAPDAIVCRTPYSALIGSCAARGIRVLPNFADIFGARTLRDRVRLWRLSRNMRRLRAPCISNHSLNASRSAVAALGFPAERVVPWDWEMLTPDPTAKTAMADAKRPRLFFAGNLTPSKGLGDVIEALALLRRDGIGATFSVAGAGNLAPWRDRAADLGVEDAVDLLGTLPLTTVREQMASHDIVLVPSRHDYAEGLPNTIYEALASRSALIISDHPAFAGRLRDGQDCLVFRAADPTSLASTVRRIVEEPSLYGALSAQAPGALRSLTVGMSWIDLITHFLDDPDDRTNWVLANSLAQRKG
ncbi:MAG: glycosyltransferase family 4 protein [Pseudomonadota bacterium]